MIKRITFLIITFFSLQIINAQVDASFNANQTSGCPNPFLLILNNTSTGGPFTSFNWQLTGPAGFVTQTSNTNQLSTTLNIPGFYSVSLTVCNGPDCNTEIVNNYIEVFSRPTIAMNISPLTGCPPHEVCFDGTFDPGCGTIASSVIDVRDGTVYTNVEDVCHVYPNSGSYSNFTVSVTNSCGCVTTENYTETVSVSPAPIAEFSANNTFSCTSPLNVNFTNNSTNTLAGTTYEWNIPGVVNGANSQNLTQSFTAGNYDVELIVTNPNGCTDTILKPNYIVVGNPIADFTSNITTVCIGNAVNFTDNSSGNPLTWLWTFEGHGTSANQNPNRTFNTVGTWDVTLEVTYAGGCTDVILMQDYITVEPLPTNSFIVSDSSSCTFPFTTTFTNTSTNANSTTWTFPGGTPNTYTGNGPVNVTYNANGNRSVTMRSTSVNGCVRNTTFNNVISVAPLSLQIVIDSSSSCIPANSIFSYILTPNETIANQTWTLPGTTLGTSVLANPSADYNTAGCYDVSLTVNTTNGCTVTRTRPNFICVGNKPTGSFTVTPSTICFEEEPVCVSYTGSIADTILWDFGDPAPPVWGADDASICNEYSEEPGDFTITMIPFHFGCSGDTIVYVDTVHVLDPVAAFSSNFDGCSNWNTFNFIDESLNSDSVFYTFGDPSTNLDTSSLRNPQWIYPNDDTIRTYTITQFTYNFTTGCEHEVSHDIIVYPPDADFIISDTVGCGPFTFRVTNVSLFISSERLDTRWNWTDNLQFGPSYGGGVEGVNWNRYFDRNKIFTEIGQHSISMINIDPRGCVDTISKNNVITIHGVNTGFNQDVLVGCAPLTVNFIDTSTAPLSYVESWFWDFGDNSTLSDTSNLQNPNYIFTEGGLYTVTLTATDSFGCSNSTTRLITVQEPFANFSISDTFICNNQSTNVVNSSIGNNLTYDWQFSNATPANHINSTPPSITFNSEGNQTLFLEVTDDLGCKDDTIVTLPVFNVVADAIADIDSILCFADVASINFNNISYNNIDSSSVFWDLGNGVTSTSFNPSAIYQLAGEYVVSLSISSLTGCRDTSIIDTIFVGGPYAEIEIINRDSACVCETIDFEITTWNATSPSFISGDGGIITYTPNGIIGDTIVDTISYQYCQLGNFIPQVFIDDGTCSGNVVLNDTIFIDSLIVDFDIANFNLCDSGTICFTDFSESEIAGASDIISWNWNFGDGITSNVKDPCHQYTSSGNMNVKLIVQNSFGCIDSLIQQIYIPPSPIVSFNTSTLDTCLGIGIDFWDSTFVGVNSEISAWHWDFGDNSILTDTANTQNANYIYESAGLYWVNLTVTDTFACFATDSLQIEIFALPNVDAGADASICLGDSTQLLASGADTYIWSNNYQISDVNIDNPFVYPLVDTSYFVQGTDINGCVNNDTVLIDVNEINVNFGSNVACLGDATMFFDSSNTDGTLTNWTWGFDEPTSGVNNTSNLQNPTHTYALPGNYNVSLSIQDDNACSADTIISTLVEAAPIASFTADSVCFGLANTFNSTASNGGGANIINYHWDFGDASTLADTSILQNPTFTYDNPGTYSVTLTITTDQNCIGNNDDTTFVVEVFALPNVDAGADVSICLGDSTQLLASGADTYIWSNNYQISDVNIDNPFVYPLVDTSYFVQGTDINGCVNIDTVLIDVNEINVNFGSNVACSGDATMFFDSSNTDGILTNWTWDFDEPTSGVNNTSNLQNPTHTYASPGNYNVSLSIQDDNACSADTIISTLVVAAPIASFTADSVCFGLANTFNSTASNSGGANIISYFWDFGDALTLADTSILQNPTFTYDNPGTYSVTLTITTDQNCIGNNDDTTFVVEVFALPNVDAGLDQVICLGDSTQLLTSGANTYLWSPNYQISDINIDNPFVYPLVDTSYIVLGTDANSCANQDTVNVQVNSISANFGAPNVCLNEVMNFSDSSISSAGIAVWSWDFNEPASGANNTSNLQNPSHTYLSENSFDVSLSIEDVDGCLADTIIQVRVDGAPIASFTADSVCFGLTNTFNSGASTAGGANITNYHWDFGQNAADTSILQNPTFTYNTPGSYTVCLTITTDQVCAQNFDDTCFVVQVYELPNVDFEADSSCFGVENEFIDLTTTGANGNITYTKWTFGQNVGDTISSTTSPFDAQFTYANAGNYSVILEVEDENGCQNQSTQNIAIFEKPIASFNSNTLCMNVENEFFSTSDDAVDGVHEINDYFWNFDEGAGFVNGDSLEMYLFNNNGNHDVSLVVIDEFMCSDTAVSTINILSIPEAIITGDSTVCAGTSTTLSAGNSIVQAPPAVYTWNVSTSQTSNITYLPNGNSTVTVIVTDARGCEDSTSIFIELLDKPIADFEFTPACENLPIDVNSTSIIGDAPIVDYNWNVTSNNSGNANFNGEDFVYTVTGIDTLDVELTVTDDNGCIDDITQQILVDEDVDFNLLISDAFICKGGSFVLNLNDSNQVIHSGIGELVWSPLVNVVQEDSFITFTPSFNTNYTFTASSTLGNCPDDNDNELSITVAPLPILTIDAVPNPVIAGGISYIDADVVPFNVATDSLVWTNIDGTLNTTFGFEIQATPNVETTYPAQFIYYVDTIRCTIDTSITISIIDECNEELVYSPNIFTPNHDGKNDVFKLSGYSIETFNYFRVFDRWGQLMYEGTNIDVANGIMSEGWLGDNKGGRECSSGVYVYTYELVCSNGDIVNGSGNITLIK